MARRRRRKSRKPRRNTERGFFGSEKLGDFPKNGVW